MCPPYVIVVEGKTLVGINDNKTEHLLGEAVVCLIREESILFFFFLRFFLFRWEGREKKRERNIRCVVASLVPPTGGTWPAIQASAQSTELHQPRQKNPHCS